MIKFLEAIEVCNYCTLIEAVEWITYKTYALERYDDNWDRFFEPSNIASIYQEPEETEIDKELTAFYEQSQGSDIFDSQKYKEIQARKEQESNLTTLEYHSQIEQAKHELFLALRKDDLSAYGVFYDKMKDGATPLQWNDEESWESLHEGKDGFTKKVYDSYSDDMFLDEEKTQRVPTEAWQFEGIEWDAGRIRSIHGRYLFIHFDFNELIKVFPEVEPEYITVEKRDGCLFLNDDNENEKDSKFHSKKGRKPVINWDKVHAYIALQISIAGNVLSKQDSFAQDIKDWIEQEFKKKVGISTIKGKLKPYYDIFQK